MRLTLALAVAALIAAPAAAQVTRVTNMVDRSGTITAGGVSQQVMPVNGNRGLLVCQNPASATEPLYIDFTRNATTTTSIELNPGGSFSAIGVGVPTTAVNVIAATTGHRFICKFGDNLGS